MNKSQQEKIKKLIQISKQVIQDCLLENGGIVASNTDKSYIPRRAANYRWVWPRDAAFVCLAGEILKMDITKPFLKWLYERPQDFAKVGLLFSNYATNGRYGSMGRAFQPDQMGTVLWLIDRLYKNDKKTIFEFKPLIERLAEGISKSWGGQHFTRHTVDLWEETERQTTITMENNITYSLASCARGLLCANELIPNIRWEKTAKEMLEKINQAYSREDGYFYRNVGKIADKNIDASLLGLVWPFEIYSPLDKRIISTVKKIEENLVIDGGVHRYQFDYWDSEGEAQEGGGAWPVLNFWLAIYWLLSGDKKKALKYYLWPIEKLEPTHGFLPEQILSDFRVSIYPLAWSHAMFVIASKYLGFIN